MLIMLVSKRKTTAVWRKLVIAMAIPSAVRPPRRGNATTERKFQTCVIGTQISRGACHAQVDRHFGSCAAGESFYGGGAAEGKRSGPAGAGQSAGRRRLQVAAGRQGRARLAQLGSIEQH